jgi:hypothetical protein
MIILYSNGLTEELSPINLTFTDDEILNLLNGFDSIKSKRLSEIPNTWCLWGEYDEPNSEDYNQLGSDVLEYHCYSPVLFMHDTEVDPSWNLADSIIQFGYSEFKGFLISFLDEIAIETLDTIRKTREEKGTPPLIAIEQIGISTDKRIIFSFDPNKQPPEFFDKVTFWDFAQRSYKFLKTNYKEGDYFSIFADKKMIMVLYDHNVIHYIDKLISIFQEKEDYIACSELKKIQKSWTEYKDKNPSPKKNAKESKESSIPKKRGRPRK